MNEAQPPPINLDELRLMPDWLKEEGSTPAKQYASHDYPTEERSAHQRGHRQGAFGPGRSNSNARTGGRPERPRADRQAGPTSRDGRGRQSREEGRFSPPQTNPSPAPPAPVQVAFLPDDRCLISINKQIRTTHLAYPLFGLARMFLQEPERHFVQFTVEPAAVQSGTMLYQLGEDGPITTDRALLEKIAFDELKDQFYVEQTVQKEPLKGNFTNVARCRLSGTLLGPTNYHGYQPALRALYESRFSRRMPFEEYRRNIEVSSDPALVERWKEEARNSTTVSTLEEPPTTLQNLAEARQHFRQHHFEKLVRTGTQLHTHGSVARRLPEQALMRAIRETHERELRYPAHFVQALRQKLQNLGLHIFKHRKRVVYVSLSRPVPFVIQGAVSNSVRLILDTIAQSPLCTRRTLAERVLAQAGVGNTTSQPEPAPVEVNPGTLSGEASSDSGANTPPATTTVHPPDGKSDSEDQGAKLRAGLAADLRFLVQSGHIIEFHNGTFDLPLAAKVKDDAKSESPTPASDPSRVAEHATEPGQNLLTIAGENATQVEEPSAIENAPFEPTSGEVKIQSDAPSGVVNNQEHDTFVRSEERSEDEGAEARENMEQV